MELRTEVFKRRQPVNCFVGDVIKFKRAYPYTVKAFAACKFDCVNEGLADIKAVATEIYPDKHYLTKARKLNLVKFG